jgi:hypothetical protein
VAGAAAALLWTAAVGPGCTGHEERHRRSVSSFLPRHVGRADALQCQAQSDAVVDDAPQFLGQRDPRLLRGKRRQLGEPLGNLARAGKELVGRNDLVDGAPFLGRLGVELLAGEDEIAAAYWADGLLPQ